MTSPSKEELSKKSNYYQSQYTYKLKLGSYPHYMMHVYEHHINHSEILVQELIKHNFSYLWTAKESVRDLNYSMYVQRTQSLIDKYHPNIQEVRDQYVNAKGQFCIVMEYLDYSLQAMLNDVAEMQCHISNEQFNFFLAQQLILIKHSVDTGSCFSLMEFHQTFIQNDILKVNDFRIDEYFGDERIIQNKEMHWQFNLKEIAVIMSGMLTGKLLRISQDNPKEKYALKFPGVSNDIANLVTLMAHKNDENAIHYLKKDIVIKTVNQFFNKVQQQFESVNMLISDRIIFKQYKEQFERSIELFNQLSDTANLQSTESELFNYLSDQTKDQENQIKVLDDEINKWDETLEKYEKTLKNVESKFSKIRPNLLAENEYKFKHIGKSQITSEYQEVNRAKLGPDSVDYLILSVSMLTGCHVFRIKVINFNGQICIIGDNDLPEDLKCMENYACLDTMIESPQFRDGDMIEIEVDAFQRKVTFKNVWQNMKLLAKASLDSIFCDYQRLCFALTQCKSKFKIVDQFIREEESSQ